MGKFVDQVTKFNLDSKRKSDKVLRVISLDVLRRLIIRSPVDTGRFRGNWQTGVNNEPRGDLDIKDKSGLDATDKGTKKIEGAEIGDTIFIVNNLPYAVPLENGHSQQAPAGMVGVTVTEFTTIVNEATARVRSEF